MDEDFGTFGPLDSRIRWTKWQLGMARPPNDYRKTKFPCRKTRIAGISQSKFVPTVANYLRRKMRGWMRPRIGRATGGVLRLRRKLGRSCHVDWSQFRTHWFPHPPVLCPAHWSSSLRHYTAFPKRILKSR